MGLDDKGTAFLLVVGAGLSTCVGAALVYFPSYINLASKKTLAASLGISAGVMLYVSFIEIFTKSQGAFEEYGCEESDAYLYATLCFFAGFIFMMLLDKLVHQLDPDHVQQIDFDRISKISTSEGNDRIDDREDVIESDVEIAIVNGKNDIGDSGPRTDNKADLDVLDFQDEEKDKLERMGLVTALAIGIHNFPEGLATFVATLDDPVVGIALAVAIAIHNIPEGVCVAMPIYFASGNRHKAFLWAVISGASEIVAAALGWIVLSNVTSQLVYAILFGLVAGMMVNICAYQLIPTAHKYDPQDYIVSHSLLAGMIIMAISLVSFLY